MEEDRDDEFTFSGVKVEPIFYFHSINYQIQRNFRIWAFHCFSWASGDHKSDHSSNMQWSDP